MVPQVFSFDEEPEPEGLGAIPQSSARTTSSPSSSRYRAVGILHHNNNINIEHLRKRRSSLLTLLLLPLVPLTATLYTVAEELVMRSNANRYFNIDNNNCTNYRKGGIIINFSNCNGTNNRRSNTISLPQQHLHQYLHATAFDRARSAAASG